MNIHIERQLLEYRSYKIMTYSAGTGQETLLILHGGPGVLIWQPFSRQNFN
ncbi:hypothetical protein PsalN5692_03511 [Piscirickettsia salmonis]|nr:hypothetical protein PsalN5692_03511 [Piscirickettsia salmonis]